MIINRFLISALLLIILLSVTDPSFSAEIFKYIDKNGIIHYTDNMATIPPEYLQQLDPFIEMKTTEPPSVSPAIPVSSIIGTSPTPAVPVDTPPERKTIENTPPAAVSPTISGIDPEPRVETAIPDTAATISDPDELPSKMEIVPSVEESLPAAEEEEEVAESVTETVPNGNAGELIPGPAPDEPAATERLETGDAAVTVKEIPQTQENAELIRQLSEKRKTLEQKKEELDSQYQALLEEREQLDSDRETLDSKEKIETYNQKVEQLNIKIQSYRDLRQSLETEVEIFNSTLKE